MKMRQYALCIICVTLSCALSLLGQQATQLNGASRQNADAFSLYQVKDAQIRLVSGTHRKLLNLAEDIQGCFGDLRYEGYPPRKTYGRAAAKLVVVDKVMKDDKRYVILHFSAPSNCNVAGHCGGETDHTLVWLKLDAQLALEEKRAVAVQQCQASLLLADLEEDANGNVSLKLKQGKLVVKYEDNSGDAVSHTLSYDRRLPEQGLVITTKNRAQIIYNREITDEKTFLHCCLALLFGISFGAGNQALCRATNAARHLPATHRNQHDGFCR